MTDFDKPSQLIYNVDVKGSEILYLDCYNGAAQAV